MTGFSLVDIERATFRYFKTDLATMFAHDQSRGVSRRRFVLVHLARKHTAWSLPRLGERYGRHHTAILWAQNRAAALMERGGGFAADVAAIQLRLETAQRENDRLRALVAAPLVAPHTDKPDGAGDGFLFMPWPPRDPYTTQLQLFERV